MVYALCAWHQAGNARCAVLGAHCVPSQLSASSLTIVQATQPSQVATLLPCHSLPIAPLQFNGQTILLCNDNTLGGGSAQYGYLNTGSLLNRVKYHLRATVTSFPTGPASDHCSRGV